MGLLAVAVATLALWEAAPALGTRFVGIGAVDHFGTLWFHARLPGPLAELERTHALYFPWGQDLLRNTGLNLLDAVLALPFRVAGPVLGHNLFLLGVLVANGLAAAAYARDHTTDRVAATIAGLAFAVAPYPLYELVEGRPAQALLAVFVLFVRAFERALRGTGPAWVAGLWLGALGWQYWFYGFFAGVLAAVGAAAWAFAHRSARPLVSLGVLALVAGVLVAPAVVPLARALAGGDVPGLMDPRDPSGLLLHSFQPFLGVVGSLDGDRFVATQRALPLALGVAALGLLRRGDGRLAHVAMVLALLLVAVGPVIVLGGRAFSEPLYVAVAEASAALRRLWHPSRALAGVVVLGIAWLARLPRPVGLLALALGLGEVVRDGLLPLPTWDASVPAGYRCLATGDAGALLELPFPASQRHLWYQVVHGRPISGGMHEGSEAFQPPEAVAWRSQDAFVTALVARSRGGGGGDPGPGEAVAALGYRFVVLQEDELPRGSGIGERTRRRRIEEGLRDALGPPAWDDARTTIWSPWGHPLPCAEAPVEPDVAPGERLRDRTVLDLGSWEVER